MCTRKFTSNAALKRHTESKHSGNLVSFLCIVCKKSFKTKWSLSTHTSRFHRKAMAALVDADDEPEFVKDEQSVELLPSIDWINVEALPKGLVPK